MYVHDEIQDVHMKNGEFFDFEFSAETKTMAPTIDYTSICRREIIVVSKDPLEIEFGDIKKKKEIKTIDGLRSILKELVLYSKQSACKDFCKILCKDLEKIEGVEVKEMNRSFDAKDEDNELNRLFDIKDEDIELLINQLIFDILRFKPEVDDSAEMTFDEYYEKYFYHYLDEKWIKTTANDFPDNKGTAKARAVKNMKSRIKSYISFLEREKSEEKYKKYESSYDELIRVCREGLKGAKMPKSLWDIAFLNNLNLITSYQYRRNFVIKHETDYAKFANKWNNYDKYIEAVMNERAYDDSDKDYFYKHMRFYSLESLTRMGLMYKLAGMFKEEGLLTKHEIHSLIKDSIFAKNYYDNVFYPYEDERNGSMFLDVDLLRFKSYPPIILDRKSCTCKRILNDILKKSDDYSFLDDIEYDLNIYTHRSKVYELFNYHYTFISENYKELSGFLRKNYDIAFFQEKNKIWKEAEDSPTQAQKTLLNIIQVINEYVAPPKPSLNRSNARAKKNETSEPVKHEKIDEETIKAFNNEDYLSRLGMDKETFEKILNILESAYKKLHTSGGRPKKLSELEHLIIAIEHIHKNRTQEDIGDDYKLSSNQICKMVKWVKDTLQENGISIAEILNSERD